MKNTETGTSGNTYQESPGSSVTLFRPLAYLRDRLLSIYLTCIELLYIFYK